MALHGANEEAVARQAYMSGNPLPDFIENAPELHTGLQFYMQAFFDLDTERPSSFGIASIPTSAIRNYGVWYKLSKDEIDDLCFIIREMDKAHIKRVSNELAKKSTRPS